MSNLEWFVLCQDDEGVYTLADVVTYQNREDAEAHKALVTPSRNPLVAYIDVDRYFMETGGTIM